MALTVGWAAAQDEPATPFLGLGIDDDPSGVLVTSVLPDSPAAEAGILTGDVITAVDGKTAVASDLTAMLSEYAVGDPVELTVLRGDETLTLSATLGDRADFDLPEAGTMPRVLRVMQRPYIGIELEDTDDGVAIRNVMPGSPAEEAGLEAGDIIVSVNDDAVDSAEALIELVRGMEVGDTVTLEFTRDGETQTVDITLGSTMATEGRPFAGRGFAIPGMRFGLDPRHGDVVLYDGTSETWRLVQVSEDGPLYEAGLRSGDIISAIDGEAVGPDTLDSYLEELDEDADVTLTVERDGEEQDIVVGASDLMALLSPMRNLRGLRGMDDLQDMVPFSFSMPMMARPGVRLGVTVVNLNADTAAEHEVDVTEGALITDVEEDTPAAEAGLQVGDIVTAVDGDIVDEERTLRDRLYAYEPDDTVTLTILRDGEEMTVEVTLVAATNMFMGEGIDEIMPFFRGFQIPSMPDASRRLVPADAPRV